MSYQSAHVVTEPTRSEVDEKAGVTVLEFGAPWCGHCIAAQPALRELLAEANDVDHLKVEDGRGKPLGRSFAIKLWPTVLVLRDGVEMARVVRPLTADDLEPVRAILEAAPPA